MKEDNCFTQADRVVKKTLEGTRCEAGITPPGVQLLKIVPVEPDYSQVAQQPPSSAGL